MVVIEAAGLSRVFNPLQEIIGVIHSPGHHAQMPAGALRPLLDARDPVNGICGLHMIGWRAVHAVMGAAGLDGPQASPKGPRDGVARPLPHQVGSSPPPPFTPTRSVRRRTSPARCGAERRPSPADPSP